MTQSKPNPGSYEAQEQGCTCPVWDNAHGQGYMNMPNHFVVNRGCPLHDPGPNTSGRTSLTITNLVTTTGEINAANGWYEDTGEVVGCASPMAKIAATAAVALPLARVIEAIRKPEDYDLETHLRHLEAEAGILDSPQLGRYAFVGDEADQPVVGSRTEVVVRLMLMLTEIAEAIEEVLADNPSMLALELADIVIRVADLVALWNMRHPERPIDLEAAIMVKLAKNRSRGYRHGGKRA